MSDSGYSPDEPFDSTLDDAVLVGMWADRTAVHRERDAFTVDFIRHVPAPRHRILVARALVAPVVALELRDELDRAWRAYSGWSMPEEGE